MRIVICEKANAARRIAQILSGGQARQITYRRVPYFVFERGGQSNFVIGLRGHIVDLDFPEKYKRWSRRNLKDMVWTDPVEIVTSRRIASALEHVYREARKQKPKGIIDIVVATDYDREGELIGVEGLNLLRKLDEEIRVKRARFSALTPEEIENAFEHLEDIDFALADSAESRRIVDLLWGAVLTRFLSLVTRQKGSNFLSVGRVQTPTLALLAKRELEIEDFVPKRYWTIQARLRKGIDFTASHIEEPFWVEDEARRRYGNARTARSAQVLESKTEERDELPPTPFDTTAFLREATKIGFSAAKAMAIAEDLYNSGLISYPRTDNTVYPKSIDLRGVVGMFLKSEFSSLAEYVLQGEMTPTRGKRESKDHPPLYPVSVASPADLTRDRWKIYELVVRRFLATLAPPARIQTARVRVDLNGEGFVSSGLRVLDPGWHGIYIYHRVKEVVLPDLSVGEEVEVLDVSLIDKKTRPPKRYSQGSLIQEMERLGLGTKSTRHEIVQKLYSRGYIRGKTPVPTPTGMAVVTALEKYAGKVTGADLTAELEDDMQAIAEGKASIQEVVKKSRHLLSQILDILEKNQQEIGMEIRKALLREKVIADCECGGTLYMMRSREGKRFVGCSNFPKCRITYPLPPYGRIESKGERCERCGAPVIAVHSKGRRTWVVCLNLNCPSKEEKKG